MRPDDPAIVDQTFLLRALVARNWWIVVEGMKRPTSLAFFDGSGETSCHLDNLGRRQIYSQRYRGVPAARFTAQQARSCGFHLTPDPAGDPEESPEHVLLTYNEENPRRKIYQGACKALALLCEFIEADCIEADA